MALAYIGFLEMTANNCNSTLRSNAVGKDLGQQKYLMPREYNAMQMINISLVGISIIFLKFV